MNIMRICRVCESEHPIEYYELSNGKTRRHQCKFCRSAQRKKSYPKWLENNYEKRKKYEKDWWLKKQYNISLEQYEEMLKRQNGVCAICKQKCNVKKVLSVDHNHKTGTVRELLCMSCNTVLGQFNEDPKLFQAAIDYLEKWQT